MLLKELTDGQIFSYGKPAEIAVYLDGEHFVEPTHRDEMGSLEIM